MKLADYASIAQVVLPLITLAGIVVSMWLSVKALREVQTDRKIRQMPHLAFEIGGGKYPIVFEKVGAKVGGIDPKYAALVFKEIPKDADSIGLATDQGKVIVKYGKLRNYGQGTALSTSVSWIPQKVYIGSEVFNITNDKL